MIKLSRRTLLGSVSAAALAALAAQRAAMAGDLMEGEGTSEATESIKASIFAQGLSEQAWAFFRSCYQDKDNLDMQAFVSHFAHSAQAVYQDAVFGFEIPGFDNILASFLSLAGPVLATLGKGTFTKIAHVTGDMRYGVVVEYVDGKNIVYSTNGITIQSVIDLDNGLIARNTDYWDSRELGLSDIVGPVNTSGVAVPVFGPVHPGGTPRLGPSPVPPGPVQLATGFTGLPSASYEMVSFVRAFHEALQRGRPENIANFFTEDALYVNPLLHQGAPGYDNFDGGIQIRGRALIAKLFGATLQMLPDCRASKLVHVVGGPAGGGFEWKAGGQYGATGLDRTGLVGCTALDLFGNRIQRMSVKFDSFQMDTRHYDAIRDALLNAGVVDQHL
jgi:hypothetical protein